MLVALTGGQKLGLLVVAGVYIVFALASSFLLPRSRSDFPGQRGLVPFIAVTLVLFASMLTAVTVLAKESEEAGGEAAAETRAGGESDTAGGETDTAGGETDTAGGGETGADDEAAGDPGAGRAVFASAGCGGCHALSAAESSGNVGPNLDEASPSYDKVVERVTNGKGAMPSFDDQLSERQIEDVAAYVSGAVESS